MKENSRFGNGMVMGDYVWLVVTKFLESSNILNLYKQKNIMKMMKSSARLLMAFKPEKTHN